MRSITNMIPMKTATVRLIGDVSGDVNIVACSGQLLNTVRPL